MKLRIENKIPLGAITNMIQLGKIYQLQNKPGDELTIWQQALEQSVSLNAKPKISQLHSLLSDFYKDAGDTTKSYEHFIAYHTVQEELNREDGEKKIKRAEILFAAEQTAKENAIIKAQKAEIEHKNKELQETIDELTITKVSRRAKALTLLVAVIMILLEEPLMHLTHRFVIGEENEYLGLAAKVIIVLSLKPIDSAIEHYLLKKIVIKKKPAMAASTV
jgi:hypothetical protein